MESQPRGRVRVRRLSTSQSYASQARQHNRPTYQIPNRNSIILLKGRKINEFIIKVMYMSLKYKTRGKKMVYDD